MTSWTWVAKTLKNLRLANPSLSAGNGPVTQSRSPPLMSAAAAAVVIVPPKPKKPLTPYFRFLGQVREDVKKQNPNLKVTELMKKVAQRWDSLDDAGKSRYTASYKKEMEAYSTVLENYRQSLTPAMEATTEQLRMEKQMKKDKRERRRRLKEMGKPKKPVTAFLLYLQSKVPPGSSIEDHQKAAKELAVKWKAMSTNEKAPYMQSYQEDYSKYEKELGKWETKMIKQGHEDLVRVSQLTKMITASAKSKRS